MPARRAGGFDAAPIPKYFGTGAGVMESRCRGVS